MLLKALIIAAALGGMWMMLRRNMARRTNKTPKLPAQTLVKCKGCGAYRLPGAPCECDDA